MEMQQNEQESTEEGCGSMNRDLDETLTVCP
jgi:hypothetical protein